MVLAAASATAAGRPGGRELLDDALERAARALLGRRVRHGRRAVGRVVLDPRRLPRRQRQHAHGRGAARRPPTCSDDDACGRGRCGSSPGSCTTSARGNEWRIPEHFDDDLDPAAGLQRRRAGAPVPAVRRDDRPLARVGPAGAAPARRPRRPAPRPGCSTTPGRCSTRGPRGLGRRRRGRVRLHRGLVGHARRTRADALGGRRGHRHRGRAVRRDRRPGLRGLVRHLVGPHRRLLRRPRARLLAPRAVPGEHARPASPGRASRTPTTRSRPR